MKMSHHLTLSCTLISIARFSSKRRAVSVWPPFVAASKAVIFFIPILFTLALYFSNKSTICVWPSRTIEMLWCIFDYLNIPRRLAQINGVVLFLSHRLDEAPARSKNVTMSIWFLPDAQLRLEIPCSSIASTFAPQLNKYSTTLVCPWYDAHIKGVNCP